jgi:mono/diheme cytochrome c family protein
MNYVSSRLIAVVFAIVVGVMFGACLPPDEQPPTAEEMIARGQYLVAIGGCNDCHTPKVFAGGGTAPDHSRMLSGHPADLALPEYSFDNIGPGEWVLFNEHQTAAVGPWGVSFAANLTPDEETGIGDWTAEEFIGGLRTGTHRGIGRPILPPMPWFNMALATDQDLEAIFAYLQSIPAIDNQVPDAIDPPSE